MNTELYQTPKGLIRFDAKDHGLRSNYLKDDYSFVLMAGEEIAAIHKRTKIVVLQSIDRQEYYLAEIAPRTQEDEPDIVIKCKPNHRYFGITQKQVDGNRSIICLNLIGVVVPGLCRDGDGNEYEGKIEVCTVPDIKYVEDIARTLYPLTVFKEDNRK